MFPPIGRDGHSLHQLSPFAAPYSIERRNRTAVTLDNDLIRHRAHLLTDSRNGWYPSLIPYPIYTSFLHFPLISMGALDSLGLDANQGR